jgi:hypothetical protein
MSISFLNLDLDAFLSDVAHSVSGDERCDPDFYKPLGETGLRTFLEEQCHLSPLRRVPGRFVVHHDGAFDYWKELVAKHRTQIDLIHVDAHADLGMGDASWFHIVSEHLFLPPEERCDPPRGSSCLNLGSYIAYALAARWIASVTYVHHPMYGGKDIPPVYFENNNSDPPNGIQLKAFDPAVIAIYKKGALDYDDLTAQHASKLEPLVPLTKVAVPDFHANRPFQYALLCQSPGFTPETADALIPIFAEYIDFERPPEDVIAENILRRSRGNLARG